MGNARTDMDRSEPIPRPTPPGQPIAKAAVEEMMRPFGVDAIVDYLNDHITQAATEGKRVLYARASDVARVLRGKMPAAPTIQSQSMVEATDRFRTAGYTVTRLPGDYRESESWKIEW